MNCDRRAFATGLASLALGSAFPRASRAQQLERPSLRLGVANKSHLYYLPVTLAGRRGYFRDYGLNVSIVDFEGGSQSLDALLGGSVDLVTGAYEHVLHTQAKGQDIRALIELGRFPGIVLAVRKDRPYKSPADLKGMKIGVTAPGSSSHFFVLDPRTDRTRPVSGHRTRGAQGPALQVARRSQGHEDRRDRPGLFVSFLRSISDGKGWPSADRRNSHWRRWRPGRSRGDEERQHRRDGQLRSGDHATRAGRNYPDRDRYPLSAGQLRDLRRHQSGCGALCQAGFHRRESEHHAGARDRVL